MPIKNFETLTAIISEQEKQIALMLLKEISSTKRPRQTSLIINYFRLVKGIKLTAPKVRSMVHYLRTELHAPIIGTSRGYYMATDINDVTGQITSLEQRARSIQSVADALKKITILA